MFDTTTVLKVVLFILLVSNQNFFFSKKRAALRAQSHDQEAGMEKIKTGLDFSYLFASSRCGRAFRSFKVVGFVFIHAVYFVFYSTSFIIFVVFSGTIYISKQILRAGY